MEEVLLSVKLHRFLDFVYRINLINEAVILLRRGFEAR